MKKDFITIKNVLMKPQPSGTGESKGSGSAPAGTKSEGASEGKDDDDDGIEAQIDKGVNLNKEAVEAAAEEIVKRNKERRKDESIRLLNRSAYTVEKQRLTLRLQRRKEKADKAYMDAVGALEKELNEGKHDKTSWEKAFEEISKKRTKAYTEADTIYREYCNKLKQLYPDYYCYDWDRFGW